MNIDQIRQKMAYVPNRQLNLKESTVLWVGQLSKSYPIALTLTLKQVLTELRPNGTAIYRISEDNCKRIAQRFIQKLNREVFGKASERFNLGLKYLVSIEGDGISKNFHLHLAIGNLPEHIRFNQIERLVKNAKSRCEGIDEQYEIKIAGDSGWGGYICKELSKRNTDRILWELS